MTNPGKNVHHQIDENSPLRIAIVLSTWNGEKFLPELLKSLKRQTWLHWDLWVRDDGSDDGTVGLLEDFAKQMEHKSSRNRVWVKSGGNIGAVRSFLTLLTVIHNEYDAYAFCDQDDVWLPRKLERAATAIKNHQTNETDGDKPFLYHAGQWLEDQRSGKRTTSTAPVRTGFANALVQNQVVGCTMVINQALRTCLLHGTAIKQENDPFSDIIMHDWWCYLLASGFGAITYDPEPVIIFRRHEQSTTPVAVNYWRALQKRLAAMNERGWSVSHIMRQAKAFSRLYAAHTNDATGDIESSRDRKTLINKQSICVLPVNKKQQIGNLLRLTHSGFLTRILYLFFGEHKRAYCLDTFIFRLMVLQRRF